jgi:hypothetical protein
MKNRGTIRISGRIAATLISFFLLFLLLAAAEAGWLNQHYGESFLTKEYCDKSNTTAWWDTISGELRLQPGGCVSVGSYNTAGGAHDLVISGNYLYVADQSGGLTVLSIADPASPSLVTSTPAAGDAHGVAIAGNYLYVADYGYGLRVFDVSIPSAPIQVGTAPAGVYSECVSAG